ncbi:DNA mismatch repair protein, partial [Ascosphaera atra]
MSAEAVIKPLPEDVIARVRSSIAINNLTDVVLELVKNSVDANARTLGITVDFPRGACTVEDCGSGIPEQEFSEHGGLALRY